MKIALAQLNYHIGNFTANNANIIRHIERAKADGADLIVFSELAVGGYPAKDLLRNTRFIQQCTDSLNEIARICQGISCIIGAPVIDNDMKEKSLCNAAVVLADGQIQHVYKKNLLPDFDVFNEHRYFEPGREVFCLAIGGEKVALTIGEDLRDAEASSPYVDDLLGVLKAERPTLLINIAASPFAYNHFKHRLNVLKHSAIKMGCPLLYVNQVGAHTDIIFDGRSLVLNQNGDIISRLPAFEEGYGLFDTRGATDSGATAEAPEASDTLLEIASIHQALILGLRDYFKKSGFKKAVLGLSGGLDSALVAALACEALGAENVLAILLPSVYSTEHSLKDALDLVANTGCSHQIVPIKDVASAFDNSLAGAFSGHDTDLTEENIQARIRGTILMAFSNKFGNILLNTSNKSEAAVGYGTLYGDMAGSLSVIGDVYKTQAYALARYINREREIIPLNTLVKPPSAELRPDQKDSDSLPPYNLLDAILYQLIELEKPASTVIQSGFDEALVKRISKLLNGAEFKRFQAPPTLRVSSKAFGSGRLMPLVAPCF